MEKIVLDDLKEDSLFHFTHQESLDEIEKSGLKPVIGANANGVEETPKIFFSKGKLGVIKVTEVWLRWLMNKIYGVNDRLGMTTTSRTSTSTATRRSPTATTPTWW